MKSRIYRIAKTFFDEGIWSADDLKALVVSGDLTKKEYKEITGKAYKEG